MSSLSPPILVSATRSTWVVVFLAALGLGLAFQGSRGVWEPDEGFYVNAAVGMRSSGDWLVPRVNRRPFLDKPPLVYWSQVAGMELLGVNEWGARAGHALWFAGSVLFVGLLGARWWGRRTGLVAAFVYATSLGPFLAANVLTPDTLLACTAGAAYYFAWRLEEASSGRPRAGWGAALGIALGLGALAKGPAILVLGAPLAVFFVLRRRARVLTDPGVWAAGLVCLALAAPWYAAVIARLPGAAGYLLDNQVLGRLASSEYGRNPGWSGGFVVYLPTLLVGSLPWGLGWLGRRGRRPGATAGAPALGPLESAPEEGARGPVNLLLALWVLLPLTVFLVASSRLPLYVLPLFAPLALATARRLVRRGWLGGALRPAMVIPVLVWAGLLVGLKGAAAWWPSPRDSRLLAQELGARGVPPHQLLVTVDTKKNGLALYGYDHLEQVTAGDQPYPFFATTEQLRIEADEMARDGAPRRFLVSNGDAQGLVDALRDAGIAHSSWRLDDSYLVFETPAGAASD